MSFLGVNNWTSVALAAGGVVASPLIWNIVARSEYRTHWLTRLCGGKYPGCYALAAWIFFSSIYRDWLFVKAINANKATSLLTKSAETAQLVKYGGYVSGAIGSVLVLSSYYRLKITGTYLGDYCGIYMEERVTSFPFNVCVDPMYTGSTLCFLGQALEANSLVGVALAGWVWLTYKVATVYFEDPFTTKIYQERDQNSPKKRK